jgi:hypothetical protein
LFALGYAAAFVACALPGGLSGGNAPAAEGDGGAESGATGVGTGTPESGTPVTDSGTTPDADAEAGAPLVNLLSNGDFALGCAGWQTTRGTSTSSPNGRNGSSACEICGGPFLDFLQELTFTTAPNQEYYGEIWVRTPADAGPPLDLALINEFSNGGNEPPATTTGPTTDTSWTKVTALLTTHADGVGVTFDMGIDDSATHCLLLDDAVVARLK